MHAESLLWRDADDTFLGWYVDILLPLRRTDLGFDTRNLVPDIVIGPDRIWHCKDEDELAWPQEQGAPHRAGGRGYLERGQARCRSPDGGRSNCWRELDGLASRPEMDGPLSPCRVGQCSVLIGAGIAQNSESPWLGSIGERQRSVPYACRSSAIQKRYLSCEQVQSDSPVYGS